MTTALKRARKARNQTLKDVASAVGVDIGNLSRIERQRQRASLALAERLVKHFDGDISEMDVLYPERDSCRTAEGVNNG
jgi:putative transcriptional regulator